MRVIVVGAGVVGLTCAVRLLEAGHRVDVVARDLPRETTSIVAAALWYPHRALPEDRVTAWSARTYEALAELANLGPGSGVSMLAGTEVMTSATADPWWHSAVPSLSRVTDLPGVAGDRGGDPRPRRGRRARAGIDQGAAAQGGPPPGPT